MNINNITQGIMQNANRQTMRQFQSASSQQLVNPVFHRDTLNLGSTSSPYQTYAVSHATSGGNPRDNILNAIAEARVTAATAFTAKPTALSREPFNIRNHYAMPPEDVQPLLGKLKKELDDTDFSGMTAAEIYAHIESKYAETFGEDFMTGNYLLKFLEMDSQSFSETDVNTSNFMYVKIGLDFEFAVASRIHNSGAIGPNDSVWDVNRKRLYGDMSNGEIMDALKAKYPQPMTNRSLSLMAGELWSIGLLDLNVGSYVQAHTVKLGENEWRGDVRNMPPWEELEKRWNDALDKPADLSLLGAIQNVYLRDKGASKNSYVQQTTDLLVKLGVETGRDGLFLRDLDEKLLHILFGYASDDTASLLDSLLPASKSGDDMIDDFLEALDRHDESLREAKEQYEETRETREDGEEQSVDV